MHLDLKPIRTLLLLYGVALASLLVVSGLKNGPLFLASADAEARLRIFDQLVPTAATFLGLSLTVLAILHAFPDRPRVAELRSRGGWHLLQRTLLLTGALCLLLVVLCTICLAVDDGTEGIGWLDQWVIATAFTIIASLTLAGVAFAGVLEELGKPVVDEEMPRGGWKPPAS